MTTAEWLVVIGFILGLFGHWAAIRATVASIKTKVSHLENNGVRHLRENVQILFQKVDAQTEALGRLPCDKQAAQQAATQKQVDHLQTQVNGIRDGE